jgi:protein-export membrane protein SecD
MARGRLRRSGLLPAVVITVVAVGALVATLVADWGPKLGLDLEGGFSVTLQPVEDTNDETLDQAIDIIRTRVDALGVAEPEITRQGQTIVVSLPGVTDRERARELVGQTAELRFRPVLLMVPGDISDVTLETTTTTTAPGETTTTLAPGETTTTTAPIDAEDALEVTSREDDDPTQTVILQEVRDDEVVASYQLGPSEATGEIVSTASADLSQSGEWSVGLEITGDGIDAFNSIAGRCFAKDPSCPTGQLAIVLDSQVVSAPEIQQPSFSRDEIQISGSFSEGDAKDLALVLRYGSLPVALETQQTLEVSATLGNDSLRAALVSGFVGLLLVFAYMVFYYRRLGLVAMASLAISGALLWTMIAWLGESRGLALTLAGITGSIVSIGVAVDSNLVFYAHLMADVPRGRTPRTAVKGSFDSAFSTIVKADVASLIGATVLYLLTVGPVRGFALFLGLSTVLDLIASWFFMRPVAIWMARRPKTAKNPGRLGLPAPTEVSP